MAQLMKNNSTDEPFRPADKTLTDSGLEQVHDGMKVFDRDGKEVGKVDGVYLGEVNENADKRGEGAATARDTGMRQTGVYVARNPAEPAASQPFAGDVFAPMAVPLGVDTLPDVVRNRLLRLGFIRIGGGLFSSPRYALPEHIANVQGDRVNLNITKDELIKK